MTAAPLLEVAQRLREALQAAARQALGSEIPELTLTEPPDPRMGDFAVPSCLPLARTLKRPPRDIAQAVVAAASSIPGVARLEVAGPGYVNVFLDRKALALELLSHLESAPPPPRDVHDARPGTGEKVVVEHTNINPNKAAHVGHLRNAVLGDCLVRLLQDRGQHVEVQDYIDDTGVQVADVVVAFTAMQGRSPEQAEAEVRRLLASGDRPFDHECWDLYAEVGRWYAGDASRLEHRQATLHAMEAGHGALAEAGALIAESIVRCHLKLMDRIGVRYHLLPWESDILASHFWQEAFDRMKAAGALHLEESGKNAGCWVMRLADTEEFKNLEEPDKVIVRGNGTVTYTGKDIAFQMWKLGLLSRDFDYAPFHDYGGGKVVWTSASAEDAKGPHPEFGQASRVFNVIDVRQSYPQAVVRNALLLMGHEAQAAASIHYSYEMVALTPRTAEALGFQLTDEERASPYVEMSGRRGLGVKADELLELLVAEARKRVAEANTERKLGLSERDVTATAEQVAVGALRYYMVKVTRNRVIAFDIDEALQFQGEAGPYLQYSVVRAANIFRKLEEERGLTPGAVLAQVAESGFALLEDDATWAVVLAAARLPDVVARACETLEITHVAKHGFLLCQAFNAFYRDNSILHADSEDVRVQRVAVTRIFVLAQRQLLGLLGMPEPERM